MGAGMAKLTEDSAATVLLIEAGERRPRREAAAALVRLGWESEGVGYPGLSLVAVRRTRSWYGQALERWRRTRRVLRMTTAPIFRSLRRIVSA